MIAIFFLKKGELLFMKAKGRRSHTRYAVRRSVPNSVTCTVRCRAMAVVEPTAEMKAVTVSVHLGPTHTKIRLQDTSVSVSIS